jgi:hypothetical protein
MRSIFSVRNVLALLGAIVVGALGSGIWDILFKPAFVWLGTALLDVATLGKQSLVDGIYLEVAKGRYERAGSAVYELLISVFCAVTISVPILGLISVAGFRALRDTSQGIEPGAGLFAKKHREFILQRFPHIMLVSLVIQGLLAGTLAIATARMSYTIRASNFLDQSQRIIAPVITPDERLLMASVVARMRSKDDFDKVVDRMRVIAKAHELNLPDFSPY